MVLRMITDRTGEPSFVSEKVPVREFGKILSKVWSDGEASTDSRCLDGQCCLFVD